MFMRGREQKAHRASVWLALALIAAVLRGLVPAGYMLAPAAAASPGLVVVVCTAHGAVEIDSAAGAVGADQDDGQPGQGETSGEAPCVFAAAAPLAAPSPGPALAAPVRRAQAPLYVTRELAPGRGLVAPPPPATGPPSLI